MSSKVWRTDADGQNLKLIEYLVLILISNIKFINFKSEKKKEGKRRASWGMVR